MVVSTINTVPFIVDNRVPGCVGTFFRAMDNFAAANSSVLASIRDVSRNVLF